MTAAALLWGSVLAIALNLVVAPWLWPRRARPIRYSRMAQLRDQAGLGHIRTERIIAGAIASGITIGTVLWSVTAVPAVSIVAAVAGASLPFLWLSRRARRRSERLSGVWPDVVDHLVAAIRSGRSLPDAVASLAEHGPEALAAEFAESASILRGSGSWDVALTVLQERCADPVADRLCEVLRLSRELGGGNLIAVLTGLGDSLRQSAATTAEIRARQSWITNAAWLGVSAPWVVLVLLNVRAESRAAFNTPSGTLIICIGAALSVVAFIVMRRIGRIAPEPRWIRK